MLSTRWVTDSAQERFRFLRRLSGAPGREPRLTAHLTLRPCDPLPLGALQYLVALVGPEASLVLGEPAA